MVIQWICSLGIPIRSKARAITRSARVESSPPESPTTAPAVDMIHTFLKSHSLDVQDLLAALITLFLHRRNERDTVDIFLVSLVSSSATEKSTLCMTAGRNCRIRGHSSSLISQSLHIDLTVNDAVLKASAFRKHGTVLCDHILSCQTRDPG